MSRSALLAAVLLVLSGCVGGPGPASPTTDAEPTIDTTASRSPTGPAARDPVRVHYALDVGGSALDEFRSVTVTVRSVAFREGTGSQCHGPLHPEDATLTPTKTPDPDPGLDCVVFEVNRTLDVTEHQDGLSLGAYTVPAVVAADTFVVVTPVNGTLQNGTTVRFDPDDPGFAVEPIRDGELRRVGISVDEYRSGYGVGPAETPTASAPPAMEYAVDVEGRIRSGESVTVSVSRNGEPQAGHPVSVGDRTVETGDDGSLTVRVEGARVFEIWLPTNATG